MEWSRHPVAVSSLHQDHLDLRWSTTTRGPPQRAQLVKHLLNVFAFLLGTQCSGDNAFCLRISGQTARASSEGQEGAFSRTRSQVSWVPHLENSSNFFQPVELPSPTWKAPFSDLEDTVFFMNFTASVLVQLQPFQERGVNRVQEGLSACATVTLSS